MISDNPEYLPRRATKGSAGYDFYSPREYQLGPDEWTEIDTGVRFTGKEKVIQAMWTRIAPQIPEADIAPFLPVGWYMEIVPRSGLATKYGLKLANTTGVIDQDYRKNIIVKVKTDVPYRLKEGERFVQGIVQPFCVFFDEIEPSRARKGGMGSTGEKK